MSRAPSVTFRVDASREAGLGHLRRCLILADRLREMKCNVRFVCREPLEPEIESLLASYTLCYLGDDLDRTDESPHDPELRDADMTLSIIEREALEKSWVVVDSYELGHGWERRVRSAGHRILAIDDFRHRMHHADLLLSDSDVPFDPALNELTGCAQVLFGRRYALIGPEYAYSGAAIPLGTTPRHLLISYGAADQTGETMKAIHAIGALKERTESRHLIGRVDVVVGKFNPFAEDVARAARGFAEMQMHVAPHGLATLMRAADLFLTAGGNSLVEALALRKPCLVTLTADNQTLMVAQLAEEGVVRSLGAHDRISLDEVADALTDVLTQFNTFVAHVASHPVFDHLGAHRVAAAILSSSADATRNEGYAQRGKTA